MVENKSNVKKLTEFNKIIDASKIFMVKLDDEDTKLLLLSSLFGSFKYFKDVLHYGKECHITLEEVQSTVEIKELT